MPVRVQLRRTKGWRMPADTVKVDRTTRYGNPFTAGESLGAKRAVWIFRLWANPEGASCTLPMEALWHAERRDRLQASLPLLRGKNLACWCALDAPCHADVLLDLANRPDADTSSESDPLREAK